MSGFTSFLKKMGQILATGLEIIAGVSPLIIPLLGSKAASYTTTAVNDLTAIGTTVIQMEAALQGKTGTEKLSAAAPLVRQIVQTSELVSGHKVANEPEFVAGCTDLTNAVVRILNSLAADNIKATGDTTPQPAAVPAVPVAA